MDHVNKIASELNDLSQGGYASNMNHPDMHFIFIVPTVSLCIDLCYIPVVNAKYSVTTFTADSCCML